MARKTLTRQLTIGGLFFFTAVLFTLYVLKDRLDCFRLTRAMEEWNDEESDRLSLLLVMTNPRSSKYQFLRARVLRRIGHFSEAGATLKIAEDLKWDPLQLRRESILSAVQSGGVRGLSAEINAVLNSSLPDSEAVEVYNAIANGHLAAYDVPEFLKCVDFWLEWQPGAQRPRLLLADFLFRIGNHASALEQFAGLVNDYPDSRDARFGLAKCQLALNDAAIAVKNFQICHQERPNGKTAVNLAKCYVRLGRDNEALQILEQYQGETDRATKAEILEELGRWHVERGKITEARDYIVQCLEVAPENFSAWHALSMIHSLQGNSDAAHQALERSQQLQKDASRLLAVISELADNPERDDLRLEAAEICFRGSRKSEAIGWVNSVLERHPEHAGAIAAMEVYTVTKTSNP